MNKSVKTKTVVWITTQFEGIHCWPDAPEEVEFLRTPHRHMFHIKLAVQVHHDDRDVEFIMLKREVDAYLKLHKDIGTTSCEAIARELLRQYNAEWVEVSEDGENGARIDRLN